MKLQVTMEANFTLRTDKKLVPFLGKVFDKRMQGLFRFKEKKLWAAARLILVEEVAHISHRYQTNMEVYSLILVWACEFKPEVEKVKLTLVKLIDGNFLINLDSVLEWVVPGVGIRIKEGDD